MGKLLMFFILTVNLATLSAGGEYESLDTLNCPKTSEDREAASILLDRGIALFQKHEYANAKLHFQKILKSYSQNKDKTSKAAFYIAECNRLIAKGPCPPLNDLKFPH